VPKFSDEQYSDEETARRRDAVIKHMLNSPPKPRSEMKIGKLKETSQSIKTRRKRAPKVPAG
jgi:hypothetical protein